MDEEEIDVFIKRLEKVLEKSRAGDLRLDSAPGLEVVL